MKNQAHPIIVVKRRKAKSHGAAHGSWKIAYADFMTAMMAFFLVMWLISISSPKELIQIAEYFRTPLATAVTGGDRISNSESPIPGGGDDYTQSQGEVNKQPNIEELKKRMEQSRSCQCIPPRTDGWRVEWRQSVTCRRHGGNDALKRSRT